MTLDRATGEVDRPSTQAFNQIVTQDIPPDPTVADLVARAGVQSAEVAQRPSALSPPTSPASRDRAARARSATHRRRPTRGRARRGAQIALTNPRGVRTDLLRGAEGR